MQDTTCDFDALFGNLKRPPKEKAEWEIDLEKLQAEIDKIKK